MVKTFLKGKYVNLRPLTVVGVGAGFNFGTSARSWDMSRMGERL
jgi:hypothetical protein